jgi:dihydrofolate reductase
MGRKTFDSIGKPLPNRRNIIITRKENLKIEGVEVFNSLEKAVLACADDEETFVIGGGEIYREALPLVNQIYLTKVHHQFNADTFFPLIDALDWEVTFKEDHPKDDKHAFDYSFLILKRH